MYIHIVVIFVIIDIHDNTTCTDLSQIVLNRGTTDTECTEDPEVLVRSILSSLITLLKGKLLTFTLEHVLTM